VNSGRPHGPLYADGARDATCCSSLLTKVSKLRLIQEHEMKNGLLIFSAKDAETILMIPTMRISRTGQHGSMILKGFSLSNQHTS
jgi:hypothetical protein